MGKLKKTISLFLILVVFGGVIGIAKEYVQTRAIFCWADCSPPEAVQIQAPDLLFCGVLHPDTPITDMFCSSASERISYYCSMVFNYYGGFNWMCKRLS